MYIIINRTKNTSFSYMGGWPSRTLEDLLKDGNDIIVISHYSNTIKLPVYVGNLYNIPGELEYDWKDYKIPNVPPL